MLLSGVKIFQALSSALVIRSKLQGTDESLQDIEAHSP